MRWITPPCPTSLQRPQRSVLRGGLTAVALILLVACGGGGGGGGNTTARNWQTAALLETSDYGDAQHVQLAMNASGSAIAVWEQVDITNTMSIYARYYSPQAGWGAVTQIEAGTEVAGNPAVAIDASGKAIAVWEQFDGLRTNIQTNRYDPGSGWSGEQLLETTNVGDAERPSVAMDPAGNAMAAWRQNEGTYFNIKARRYVAGSGWESVTLIELEELGNADAPKVSMSSSGNAVVAWRQTDGSAYNIWANRYDVGLGWDNASKLDGLASHASEMQVRHDPAGNSLVVWRQEYNGVEIVMANMYRPGTGWSGASMIGGNLAGDAYSPQVASWGTEKFGVVWFQHDGMRTNIMSSTIDGGLSAPQLVENDNTGNAYSPQIAFDAQGGAVVLWSQSDGVRDNIWTTTRASGSSWGTPALIETNNSASASEQRLGVAADGSAVAVWGQSDGVRRNLWFNVRR